jgi:hypothetical protein
MIKSCLFTLFTAALAFFPVDGSALPMRPDANKLNHSHVRCGVMGKYDVNIPFTINDVTTELETLNPAQVCNSKLKKLEMKLQVNSFQTVSADSWVRPPEANYSLIVEPAEQEDQTVKTGAMIKKLYSRESYESGNGFPSQPPERLKGLVYIKGSMFEGAEFRDDFYLKSDSRGNLEYLIHCMIDAKEVGQCTMAFSPNDIDLNMVVTIASSDIDNYRGIANAAKTIVRTLIKPQDANT